MQCPAMGNLNTGHSLRIGPWGQYPATTVPRARPPAVLQEHPVPTGAALMSAQVLTDVAQYPPTVEDTGVWYVEYG